MTPFSVEWSPEAEDELALIWLRAADRPAVNSAQNEIDHLLSHDPVQNGRHVCEGQYHLIAPPLVVSYTIDLIAQRVEVSHVWQLP